MATVPAAPTVFSISEFTNTTVTGDADVGTSNGGATVVQWQLGYGTSTTTPSLFLNLSSTGSATVTGLNPGTTYYFWSRQRNSVGWSAWSPRNSVQTRVTVPAPPGAFYISTYTDTTLTGDADPGSNGGSAILQWQLGYGDSATDPIFLKDLNSAGTGTITGLERGKLYYFWSRQRNSVGWSAWSTRTMLRTRNVPEAPVHPIVTGITQTSMTVVVAPNKDGDSPITAFKVGYSRYNTVSSGDFTVVEQRWGGSTATFMLRGTPGLAGPQPGVTYYLWAKAINDIGESLWSPVATATLIAGAYIQTGWKWQRAVPYVKVNGVWKLARPWGRVAGVWKEIGD